VIEEGENAEETETEHGRSTEERAQLKNKYEDMKESKRG
jgi:hypothetical protein